MIRKLQIVLLVLLPIMAVTWELAPLQGSGGDRLSEIPLRGEHFQGTEVPPTAREIELLGGASIVKRHYLFDGRPFAVTVIDGTQNRKAVHDPSYCFRGSGGELIHDGHIDLPDGEARHLRVRQGAREFEVLLWFTDGRECYSGYLRYRIATALRKLTFGLSGPEPIFVMVRSPAEAHRRIDWERAARDWLPVFSPAI